MIYDGWCMRCFWTDGCGSAAAGLSVLYSNRAACRMKLGDCQGCIADCDNALELCPDSPKPLLRRAMAFEAIEKWVHHDINYNYYFRVCLFDQPSFFGAALSWAKYPNSRLWGLLKQNFLQARCLFCNPSNSITTLKGNVINWTPSLLTSCG